MERLIKKTNDAYFESQRNYSWTHLLGFGMQQAIEESSCDELKSCMCDDVYVRQPHGRRDWGRTKMLEQAVPNAGDKLHGSSIFSSGLFDVSTPEYTLHGVNIERF